METNNNFYLPKWIVVWLGFLLIVFTAFAVIDKGYQITKNLNQGPENTISISAEGKVNTVPDLATVNLGVTMQGDTAAEVQDKSSEKINQIINFVKSQGIKDEDIQTSQFNINPRYNYKDGENTVIGYQASQTVVVKIKGVDKSTDVVGRILDGATDNGANQIYGVNFSFDDPDDLKNQARKLAIANAKDKAEELAKEAGLRLGKIVSLSESGGYTPVPYYRDAIGFGGDSEFSSIAPDIQAGSQEVSQTMTIVFELK
jgi:uncharacterized protein